MRCPWGSVENLSVCPSLSGSIRAIVWLSEAICLSAFLSRALSSQTTDPALSWGSC